MKKKGALVILIIFLLVGYLFLTEKLNATRDAFLEEKFVEYTIPSQLIGPLSLEFKGLASDFLLVKFMTFIGGRTQQLNSFNDEDWRSVENTLDTITDLDPYYWDAYMFAQIFLTWDENNYMSANRLLEKAEKHITENFRIPYYIGLNYYNFAKDYKNGYKYIMKAAKLPDSPFYLASLAARFAAYSSDYERGVVFLDEMLKQTSDPEIAEQYKLRIRTLKIMYQLEQVVERFRNKFDRLPSDLSELIQVGMINDLPDDPYGGKFYIKEDGKIATTSKMHKYFK